MNVREAVDADADRVSSLLDIPVGAAERLFRDRTVTVAVRDETVVAVVAYEADPETVHVTRIAGDPDALDRLLESPIRFAENEGVPVELLVEESRDNVAAAVEAKGFEFVEEGPRFDGEPTVRYRL